MGDRCGGGGGDRDVPHGDRPGGGGGDDRWDGGGDRGDRPPMERAGEDFEKFGYSRCEGGFRLPKARTQTRQGRVVVGGPKCLPNKGVSSSRFLTKSSPPRSLSSLSSIESSFSSGGTSAGGLESKEEEEDLEHWMLYALEEEDLEGRMLYAHTSFESSVSSGGTCAGGTESKEDEEDLEGRMLYALGCVLEEEDPEGRMLYAHTP